MGSTEETKGEVSTEAKSGVTIEIPKGFKVALKGELDKGSREPTKEGSIGETKGEVSIEAKTGVLATT